MNDIDLKSLRARKAKLGRTIGKTGFRLMVITAVIFVALAVALYVSHDQHLAYLSATIALIIFILAVWYHQDLALLPATGKQPSERIAGYILSHLDSKKPQTPENLWNAVVDHWQVIFITNHFLLPTNMVETVLSKEQADTTKIWAEAARLADKGESSTIEPGHLAIALLLTSEGIVRMFVAKKLSASDIEAVSDWLGRVLKARELEMPYFGGIGRDWANGFTPQLNRFGHNISLSIEAGGAHYGWLTTSPEVNAIKEAFSGGAIGVVMVGQVGIGKTSHVYALAQRLLSEKNDRNLMHRQIIGLNPSVIISSASQPGQLENIILTLFGEAAHAGHIILFLDDAQLFFSEGLGSFDASRILLSVLQSRSIQLIMAMGPNDFQSLRTHSPELAALLTPVMINEPDEPTVIRILEDSALGLEHQHGVLITYEALTEAYKLSGRYEEEVSYPGKAIQLLEQALPYADQKIVSEASVQKAIEQTKGVKVSAATPVEADALFNLEEDIHKRMINQTRAVHVVASALRRNRAGVANPKRPIGSFLFLGPTGVGKTELAKSIAATYFGAEANMVRLDMSEYQQAEDVNRLLSDGSGESASLIMTARQRPFSVVLLDEIEKAHPNILNLLLQLLDEGRLTDIHGRAASFKDCIIIATSNAGAQSIRERVDRGESLESFESAFVDELISSSQFKPELLNRFDEIVLFRPLNEQELVQVVSLMMKEINATLSNQNISVELTEEAAQQIVAKGNDPRLGARPMRRMLQRTVEDEIANRILSGKAKPGDHVILDVSDLSLS